MAVLRIPPTNKSVYDFFKPEDNMFVYFQLTKPCLDNIMARIFEFSMAGFGFPLPLEKLGLRKANARLRLRIRMFCMKSDCRRPF